MTKWVRIVESNEQRAADRVHELVSRLRIALDSLTHVSEAFSQDDLPISFILRRDSPMTNERHGRRANRISPAVQEVDSHFRTHAATGRPGARNTLRSESHPVARGGGDHGRCHHSGSGRSNQQVS
jgi:hypothetical protein